MFLLLAVGFWSCRKYLEYEGEDAKPRLVLNGVLSPDSLFSVRLSNSLGYVDNGSLDPVMNGKVAVFNGTGLFIDSLYHAGMGLYQSTSTAQVNAAYEVRAAAGSFAPVSAVDYIPSPVPVAGWDTNIISVTEFDFTSDRLEVRYAINDPAGIENFYVIEIWETQRFYVSADYDPNTGMTVYDTIFLNPPNAYMIDFTTSDQILLSEVENGLDETLYYSRSLAYRDVLFDGRSQSFRILVDSYYGTSIGTGLELRLKSCSEAYYKYQRSLENYLYTEGDPFAQPVQVYNNIQNGLGIWAGSSEDRVMLFP